MARSKRGSSRPVVRRIIDPSLCLNLINPFAGFASAHRKSCAIKSCGELATIHFEHVAKSCGNVCKKHADKLKSRNDVILLDEVFIDETILGQGKQD